ncbi:Hpt domain-containing protein [Umboniibacter marinipuniceus]|uniref:Chemotaxis protein CheA n=1 Tax=Umboniibacter marinipuniceus TaxID=569599 RepID=A0A3M0AAQ6_9GAMM|nr:Hpt domain-containing protein [Umboniibacter marinipuniceus]RMA82231.1 chemosensory pili system protein ChpA (sensor histidine kinase/response regulator) [Umboniibacter marinipuniceus]
MAVDRNFTALDWISSELDEVLNAATGALNQWLQKTDDEAQLRFCLSYLHQSAASLRMVECYGVAVLAEELELLCHAIINSRVAEVSRATSVLRKGIESLPAFVKVAVAERADDPLPLLPILNDIRAVRSHNLFSETPIFLPDLAPLELASRTHVDPRFDDATLKGAIAKLRKMYQYALLALLRKQDQEKAATYLVEVTLRVSTITKQTAVSPIWDLAYLLACRLKEGEAKPSDALLFVLRQLDRYLKFIEQYGAKALTEMAPRGLIKNLLYEVALLNTPSDHLDSVREQYGLVNALPRLEVDDESGNAWPVLSAVDRLRIVAGIRLELNDARRTSEQYNHSDLAATQRRLIGALRRAADALSLLGEGKHAGQLESILRNIVSDEVSDYSITIRTIDVVLEQLLKIEAGRPSHELVERDAQQYRAVDEALTGLENCKDAISLFIAQQFNPDAIGPVPKLLTDARLCLEAAEELEAARVLGALARYVEEKLARESQVNWDQLDTLASAITAIEYLVESVNASAAERTRLILQAQNDVAELGYAVAPISSAIDLSKPPIDTNEIPQLISPAENDSNADNEANTFGEPDSTPIEASADTEAAQVSEEMPSIARPDIDEEILEIFLEEVEEVLEQIDIHFAAWQLDRTDRSSLTEFRRAFHTLKGSGRMVGAEALGEVAFAVEDYLNRLLDGAVLPSDQGVAFIQGVRDLAPRLVDAFATVQPDPDSALQRRLVDVSECLKKEDLEAAAALLAVEPETHSEELPASDVVPDEIDHELIGIFVAEAGVHLAAIKAFIAEVRSTEPLEYVPSEDVRRALHTLKGSAYMSELKDLAEVAAPVERLTKALIAHQVKVDKAFTDLLAGVVTTIEALIPEVVAGRSVADLIDQDALFAMIEGLHDRWIEPILGGLPGQFHSSNPEFIALISSPAIDALFDAEDIVDDWVDGDSDGAIPKLVEATQALYELSLKTNEEALSGFMAGLISLLQDARLSRDDEATVFGLRHLCDTLIDRINQLVASQKMTPIDSELELIEELMSRLKQASELSTSETEDNPTEPPVDPSLITPLELVGEHDEEHEEPPAHEVPEDETQALKAHHEASSMPTSAVAEVNHEPPNDASNEAEFDDSLTIEAQPDSQLEHCHSEPSTVAEAPSGSGELDVDAAMLEIDAEILALFVDEAEELVVLLDSAADQWSQDPAATAPNEDIQRHLHTFKGSARMAGLNVAGEIAHDLESWLIRYFRVDVPSAERGTLTTAIDQLRYSVEQSRIWLGSQNFNLIQRIVEGDSSLSAVSAAGEVSESSPETVDENALTVIGDEGNQALSKLVENTASQSTKSAASFADLGAATQFEHKAPQEVVRVSSTLLDEMVNLAGETSIARSRVEQQVTDFAFNLDEMDNTINRLREQVRRLDIETEAQILFRQEQLAELASLEGFDPLEMDRYTTLQQLSRSLSESASDLQDLKSSLLDNARDTETLLLQQGRINTDLQEGLMRSRMVMFSRLVPRLRRVVRQVSSELGKPVRLELGNVEGELDRNMLDKMVGPLEHMLRNAIDHGIEDAAARAANGKDEEGVIRIFVAREGAQVVIGLADDGDGINVERVRRKAIDSGLLADSQELSEQEIYQFIFRPGFSTRDDVSQVSGRGVGLDVVAQEVRQLGGQIEVFSERGQGSQFVVRLPFTLSVNRALMITVADDTFALPLSSVEGIARIEPAQLRALYNNPEAKFNFADNEYDLRYLGEVMGLSAQPQSIDDTGAIPLVLVKTDDHHFAMHVDQLHGSREIVVKSLGPQFASTPGLNGATILGDGTVVVILDLVAMLRADLALGYEKHAHDLLESSVASRETPLIMVVDDSVTVRKVTSRLLNREGFDVVTAKDGVDAVRQLQDVVPDVMLLDIEMPNMDGFEVARTVKTSVRLKHVPIIMITSRTGEKHRERAKEIGVEDYMGKPYQEDRLLAQIREFLSERAGLAEFN